VASKEQYGEIIPGEVSCAEGSITINEGRERITVKVENHGDRPVQIGSHYHFYEVNAALVFDRSKTRGYRLDIAAGTAIRFEPGQARTVTLVPYAGRRHVYGFRGQIMGPLDGADTGREQ